MSAVIPDPATTDWVPLGGIGIQGGLIPIQEIVLGAAAASIDLQNIPQTYRDLRLSCDGRTDGALAVVTLRFNNDSGANYDRLGAQLIQAAGITPSETLAATSIALGYATEAARAAGLASPLIAEIPYYADATYQKTVLSQGLYRNAAASGGIQGLLFYGAWRSAAAINRITLIPSVGNFAAGYKTTLYGVAAPGVTYLPQATRVVSGRVSSAGAIVGGTGFTVSRAAAGFYNVTFTTAFSDVPSVVAVPAYQPTASSNPGIGVLNQTASAFSCAIYSAGAGQVDQPFNFIAIGS